MLKNVVSRAGRGEGLVEKSKEQAEDLALNLERNLGIVLRERPGV